MTLQRYAIIGITMVILLSGWAALPNESAARREELKSMGLSLPMTDMEARAKLLTFGLYVTPNPAQNPIDPPERFTGYHTALDLEILPTEQNMPVDVYAICSGEVTYSESAAGYGGVLVQRCVINEQPVTVLYGHLDPDSFRRKRGEQLTSGETIGVLAATHSEESDGNRKHLHLGIHKGTAPEFLGYVQSEEELSAFMNPATVLKLK